MSLRKPSINWNELSGVVVTHPDRVFDFRTEKDELVHGFIKEVDGYEVFLWIHREPVQYQIKAVEGNA